jgi:hypothetical protein
LHQLVLLHFELTVDHYHWQVRQSLLSHYLERLILIALLSQEFQPQSIGDLILIRHKDRNDNQWHHVTYSLDGTNTHLYIDGQLVATGPMGTSSFNWSTHIAIGRNFNGQIRDVKIFEDTGATADEVAEIYAGETPSTLADNLIVSMDFTGSDPYDESGSGRQLIVVGTPATEEQSIHRYLN